MLRLFETTRVLRFTGRGPLPAWLGPSLRGLFAAHLKGAGCRFTPLEQRTTRRYCKECPSMAGCPVGETFEADPPEGVVLRGQDDGVRPVALAPAFPVPPEAWPGLAVPVRAVFVGERAAVHAPAFWDAGAESGRRSGVGPARVGFAIEPGVEVDAWRELPLPAGADDLPLFVPAVRVELTAPLLLRQDGATVRRPEFGHLLRAGLRVLGAFLRYQGEADGIDFAGLRQAAEAVPARRLWYEPFEQEHQSGRSGQRRRLCGAVGGGEYGPVPAALVRWLAAAGRVHVGQDRVAGAGGWRVWWCPNVDGPPEEWTSVE